MTMSDMSGTIVAEQHESVEHGGSRPRIVVGVDGSADSVAALRAGAWAAAVRGGTLTAVTAWTAPLVYGKAPTVVPDLEEAAEATLRRAIEEAFHGNRLVPLGAIVREGTAAGALVAESQEADLLVVGSRGHGGFPGLLLGSVSMACTMHARCPVLVMHTGDALTEAQESPSGARVVVGVGEGPASVEVVRTAAAVAVELDAELLAVGAFRYPVLGRSPDAFADPWDDERARAQRDLEQRVAEALLEGRPRSLRTELREGPAAAVLVDASRTADLVVVGRQGRSELAGLLLGSVSMPVAEHADCPVLVVPVPPTRSRPASRP
ncbi:MAG: hypothetical protein QOC59_240 [Microbacteriaceae bacterium]|nr:hypothetical protein [Microbacteriaceae bacterium]